MSRPLLALLTPPGKAAIATLGLLGAGGWDMVRRLFTPARGASLPADAPPGRHWFGRLGRDPGDEVIVVLQRTEPVPLVEIHAHGGRAAVRYLMELLAGEGAEACPWQRLIELAEGDSLRAAATVALAQAPTLRTAAILLDQYHGALHRALDRVVLAMAAGDRAGVAALLSELDALSAIGRHLTDPFRVVVAGAPNVGKSSLVNALAGYQRSIVAATPGTTRDVVTTPLALDGWPVELADTAGLRQGAETLEALGVEQARAAMARADLVLWVVDAAAVPVWPGLRDDRLRLVVNKCDQPPAWPRDQAGDAPHVSALTGAGVADLAAAVASWLVPQAPPPGTGVPFTEAQRQAITRLARALDDSPR